MIDAFDLNNQKSVINKINPVVVVADHREKQSGIEAHFLRISDVELSWEILETGDYCVDDAVLFERKTAMDFAQSLLSGRLFSQAARMMRSPYRAAYILEGTAEEWNGLGVSRPALQGALVTLMLIYDLPVFRTRNVEESARMMIYTGRQWMRAREGGDQVWRTVKAKRKTTRQRKVLQTLPGVGPERAKRLLAHFGTLRSCFVAEADDFLAVEGIGVKTAKAIFDTVN